METALMPLDHQWAALKTNGPWREDPVLSPLACVMAAPPKEKAALIETVIQSGSAAAGKTAVHPLVLAAISGLSDGKTRVVPAPSLVDTPMARRAEASGEVPPLDVIAQHIPIARPGTPDDIAAACEFLCSHDASYITGQQINVNGGNYM